MPAACLVNLSDSCRPSIHEGMGLTLALAQIPLNFSSKYMNRMPPQPGRPTATQSLGIISFPFAL